MYDLKENFSRSRDSRGSKDDSPAPPGDNTALLRVLPSEVSLSSLESDSQESQKRQRRLDEITEIVSEKLEPLAEDMHDLKGKLDQVNICRLFELWCRYVQTWLVRRIQSGRSIKTSRVIFPDEKIFFSLNFIRFSLNCC
jgi:hypothetical protein